MIKVSTHQGVEVFGGRLSMLGLGSLRTYLFLHGGSLIDTGPGRLGRELAQVLRERTIERVLLTHFHEDHSGNAAWIQREKGIPVFVSAQSAGICREDARLPLYRRYFWGRRPGFEPIPLEGEVQCAGGRLKVIGTPGHSHDHVCFLDRERGLLFTGDLFVTPRTRTVMRYESIPEIMESIRKVLREDFDTVFCAHAGVVEKGYGLMKNKLLYLEDLSEKVLAMHSRGIPIKKIDQAIFKPQALTYISSREWSSRHIITSIIRDSK